MKVIDLAIGFSKGIIPPRIKYKGFIYEYLKDIKDYVRLEDGHIKTLEINVEQFNEEIEIIEDTPKEDKKLEKLIIYDDMINWIYKGRVIDDTEKDIIDKLNEIIDYLKSKGE